MAAPSDVTTSAVRTWCVGIDFGTRSCAAALLDDTAKVLDVPLSGQQYSLPSYVTAMDTGFLVGASARTRARSGDASTVFDFVRLVGRKVRDLCSSDRRKWPFTVVSGENDKAVVEIQSSSSSSAVRRFAPEELAAVLFRHIKEHAEALAQATVETAVVCIPSAFNHTQRCAVRNACAIAGLRVERLVNTATAAIASYAAACATTSDADSTESAHIEGATQVEQQQELVLAVDVGASCTDISLVAVRGDTLVVQATDSELHLGGDDATDRIAAHCWRRRRKSTAAAAAPTPGGSSDHAFVQSASQLHHACELAKKLLTVSTTAVVAIDAPVASDTFRCYTLTRASVDALCADVSEGVLSRALALSRDDVTTVLLLGGSAQIPQLAELFRSSFHDKRVLVLPSGVSPARGAAALRLRELHEVTPLALGIQSVGGTRIVMIPRNTPVPVHEASLYYANCQHAVVVHILEGQSFSAPNALHRLASIRIGSSTQAPAHLVLQLDLAFEVATLDHVSVSVVERASGRRVTTQLVGNETSLSAADVARAHARLYGRIGDETPMVFVPRGSVLQIPHLTGTSLLSTQDPIQLLHEYVAALEAAAASANVVLSREDAALVHAVGVALSASPARSATQVSSR